MKPGKYFFASLIIISIFLSNTFNIFSQEKDEKEDKAFVVSFSKTSLSFDPIHTFTTTEAQVYTAIYEGLVTYHPFTLNPVPGAASSWEISEDNLKYTFHLRNNLYYWNGDKITADDFKNTWLKLIDPNEHGEYSFLLDIIKGVKEYRLGENKDTKSVGIKAIDSNTLEVELEKPASHFLKILCHHSFVPIHPKVLENRTLSKDDAVLGNGPYYIISRNNDELILKKNELYWDSMNVKINTLKILFSNETDKLTEDFNNDRLHWAADDFNIEKVLIKEAIVFHPMYGSTYFYFKCNYDPWNDKETRRAMSLLLPWEKIREGLLYPAKTLVPHIPSYPEVKGIEDQNLEEGLKILKDKGFINGKSLGKLLIKIPTSEESGRIAALMKESWEKELDIQVDIKSFPYSEYYKELQKSDYTIGTISWIGDFADPLTFLQMWTSTSNLNDAAYLNYLFDNKIEESMEVYGKERLEMLAEAESILLKDAAILPINNSSALNLIDLEVIGGWYPNALDIHPFKYLEFLEARENPNVAMISE